MTSPRGSPSWILIRRELIADALLKSDNPKDDKDEDEDEEDNGSEFYGSDRISRSNEAWDTIDPRLVKSLVGGGPQLAGPHGVGACRRVRHDG